MGKLQPIVCKLADRPKTYHKQGLKLVDGKWIPNVNIWSTGAVESHVAKMLKGRGKYYV